MNQQLKSTPEVSITSPAPAPAAGVISTEIPAAIVSTATAGVAEPPVPFGVYFGVPDASGPSVQA